MPQPSGAGLRALDVGGAHERGHLAVCALAGDVPQQGGTSSRGRLGTSDAVDELQLVDEVNRHRHRPPMLSASLERSDPEFGRLEVDVARADREELAHAASGECEGPREVSGPWALGGRGTAARNRWRSSAVRYFRPCWSTRVVSGVGVTGRSRLFRARYGGGVGPRFEACE